MKLPTNFTGPVAALDWAKTKLKLEHYEKHRLVRRLHISHKPISVSTVPHGSVRFRTATALARPLWGLSVSFAPSMVCPEAGKNLHN